MKSEILSIKIKCIKNREKEKWKMKDKIFGVLQRIGRSFMLPIAILPVAGLLLGIEVPLRMRQPLQRMDFKRYWETVQCSMHFLRS